MAERKGAKIPFPSILNNFISKAAQTKRFLIPLENCKKMFYTCSIFLYYMAKILHRTGGVLYILFSCIEHLYHHCKCARLLKWQARFSRQKEGRIRGSVARWRWPLGRPPLSTWDRQSGTDWPTPSDSAPYPQKRPCRTQGEMEYEERHKRRRRGNNGPPLAVRGACVLLKMKVSGR